MPRFEDRGLPADVLGLGTGTRDEMGWASEITYFLISEPGQRVFWSFGGMRDWRGVRVD